MLIDYFAFEQGPVRINATKFNHLDTIFTKVAIGASAAKARFV